MESILVGLIITIFVAIINSIAIYFALKSKSVKVCAFIFVITIIAIIQVVQITSTLFGLLMVAIIVVSNY